MKIRRFCILCVGSLFLLSICGTQFALAAENSKTKVVLLLMDGCRKDILDRLCAEGKLPTISKLVREGFSVESAVSVFPSTTGPAYTPFVTGLYPCNSGLVGNRMYNRKDGTLRNYAGTDVKEYNTDLNPDFPTIFELLPKNESLAFLGLTDRGCLRAVTPVFEFIVNKVVEDRLRADRDFFSAFSRELDSGFPRFTFLSLHAPDAIGHTEPPWGDDYMKALVQMDGFTKEILDKAAKSGEVENLVMVLTSDHGTNPVERIGNKKKIGPEQVLSRWGFKAITPACSFGGSTIEFNLEKDRLRKEMDAIICPSGNACVQIYLKGFRNGEEACFEVRPTYRQVRAYPRSDGRKPVDLVMELLADPGVGLLMVRDGPGKTRVFSNKGEGLIVREGDKLGYSVVSGKDPLRLGAQATRYATGALFHERDWLRFSYDDQFYPDSVFQIAQLMEAENSGDIVINAASGFDPSPEGQLGVHGGLDRSQIRVPIIFWGKGVKPGHTQCARTVDVFPTVLGLLGIKVPKGVPGIPLF